MGGYEIVVIDSGSFDGCDRMLREHYPAVQFIQSRSNLGFARANNVAFEKSTGECVLFLNPDTELTGPAVDALYDWTRSRGDAGAVGCRLLNSDGSVQTSCIQSTPTILNQLLDSDFLRRRWPRSALWGMEPLFDPRREPREVEVVSGACLMMRREVFEMVGRFTEEYFMYAEDVDLSYKARQARFRNYYLPEVAVIHHGGSSSSRVTNAVVAVMVREAVFRFLRSTRGRTYAFGYRLGMLGSAATRLLLLHGGRFLSKGRSNEARSRGKWLAVLRWSVGADGIVQQYYAPARPLAPDDVGTDPQVNE
jgi:hypothetical protein